MNISSNIYTIQISETSPAAVTQIEAVINRGLYRFTLLGMQTKHASDTKDRVYSSLRSSNLLNLKSDNRKIMVSISPEAVQKNNFYDLPVALACIYSINKNTPPYKILALGEVSISGKILPSKRFFQALYTAYIEHIPVIACSDADATQVSQDTLNTLRGFGIHVVFGTYICDLVENLKTYNPEDSFSIVDIEKDPETDIKQTILTISNMDTVLRSLYISACGGHSLLIETNTHYDINLIYKDFYQYTQTIPFGQKLYRYQAEYMRDTEVYPDIIHLNNVRNHPTKTIMSRVGTLIGTYMSCMCERTYTFFEPNTQEKRCICSKRNLIQYKRYMENTYFPLFDMKEIYYQHTFRPDDKTITQIHKQIDNIRSIQFDRFAKKHNLDKKEGYFIEKGLYLYKYIDLDNALDIFTPQAHTIWETSSREEKVFRVAMTIQDILNYELNTPKEKKLVISEQALLLALSYMPKTDS